MSPFNAAAITGSGEQIHKATRLLSTAELATLNSMPVDIIPAHGPGTLILEFRHVAVALPGAHPFALNPTVGTKLGTYSTGDSLGLDTLIAIISTKTLDTNIPRADAEDRPLKAFAGADNPYTGGVLTAQPNPGGEHYFPGDIITLEGGVNPGDGNATLTVLTVQNLYSITGVDLILNTLSIDGDHTAEFINPNTLTVLRSTGNNGTGWTIVGSVFAAGKTVISVAQALPDPTVDGALGSDLDNVGRVITFDIITAGDDYAVANSDTTSPWGGTGFIAEVQSIDPHTDAQASITVYYAIHRLP